MLVGDAVRGASGTICVVVVGLVFGLSAPVLAGPGPPVPAAPTPMLRLLRLLGGSQVVNECQDARFSLSRSLFLSLRSPPSMSLSRSRSTSGASSLSSLML